MVSWELSPSSANGSTYFKHQLDWWVFTWSPLSIPQKPWFLGRRRAAHAPAQILSSSFPAPPMAHRFLGRRAAHRRLSSSVRRGPSPTGRWRWPGNTGTAWLGLASRRCPGSSLRSPQSCSLWANKRKTATFSLILGAGVCLTADAATRNTDSTYKSHNPRPYTHTQSLLFSLSTCMYTVYMHLQCALMVSAASGDKDKWGMRDSST